MPLEYCGSLKRLLRGPFLRGCAFIAAYTQQGRAHSRRLHPAEAARPALMSRAAHAVESKAVVRIEVAVTWLAWKYEVQTGLQGTQWTQYGRILAHIPPHVTYKRNCKRGEGGVLGVGCWAPPCVCWGPAWGLFGASGTGGWPFSAEGGVQHRRPAGQRRPAAACSFDLHPHPPQTSNQTAILVQLPLNSSSNIFSAHCCARAAEWGDPFVTSRRSSPQIARFRCTQGAYESEAEQESRAAHHGDRTGVR
jgi:hypothetical protein